MLTHKLTSTSPEQILQVYTRAHDQCRSQNCLHINQPPTSVYGINFNGIYVVYGSTSNTVVHTSRFLPSSSSQVGSYDGRKARRFRSRPRLSSLLPTITIALVAWFSSGRISAQSVARRSTCVSASAEVLTSPAERNFLHLSSAFWPSAAEMARRASEKRVAWEGGRQARSLYSTVSVLVLCMPSGDVAVQQSCGNVIYMDAVRLATHNN